MFCTNCGGENNQGAKFCRNCGIAVGEASNGKDSAEQASFYSADWRRTNNIVLVVQPYLDILITKDHLYLIKMPYGGSVAGFTVGETRGRELRKKSRQTWLGESRKLVSRLYENKVTLIVPKSELKSSLVFKDKKKIVLAFGSDRYVLKSTKAECQRLNTFLTTYY